MGGRKSPISTITLPLIWKLSSQCHGKEAGTLPKLCGLHWWGMLWIHGMGLLEHLASTATIPLPSRKQPLTCHLPLRLPQTPRPLLPSTSVPYSKSLGCALQLFTTSHSELSSIRFPALPKDRWDAPECTGTGNDKSVGLSAIPQQNLDQHTDVTNRKTIQATVRKTPHTVRQGVCLRGLGKEAPNTTRVQAEVP